MRQVIAMMRLCIPCWYGECGADHKYPERDCPCCQQILMVTGAKSPEPDLLEVS